MTVAPEELALREHARAVAERRRAEDERKRTEDRQLRERLIARGYIRPGSDGDVALREAGQGKPFLPMTYTPRSVADPPLVLEYPRGASAWGYVAAADD